MNQNLAKLNLAQLWQTTPWGNVKGSVWLSSIRIAIGMCLAFYIACYFQLERPYWAMATVAVLRQSSKGSLFSRCIARISATVFGGCIAIFIAAFTINEPYLLTLIASAWLAIVAYLSSIRVRDSSYAFAIMGYTSALVMFNSVSYVGMDSLFDTATARICEVVVGIVCSATLLAILPDKVDDKKKLNASLNAIRNSLLSKSIEELRNDDKTSLTSEYHNLIGKISIVNQLRIQAIWGHHDIRRDRAILSYLIHQLFRLNTQLESVRRLLLDWDNKTPLFYKQIEDFIRYLSQPNPCYYYSSKLLAEIYQTNDKNYHFLTIFQRLHYINQVNSSISKHLYYISGKNKRNKKKIPYKMNNIEDIIEHKQGYWNALRTFIVVLLACVFAIATHWKYGQSFISLSALMCLVFCTRPYPVAVVSPAIKAILALTVACFFLKFFILTHVYDMNVFILILFPILITLKLIEAKSPLKHKAFMSFFIVLFGTLLSLSNQPVYDVGSYLNSALATSLGPILSLASYTLIQPHNDIRWAKSISKSITQKFRNQFSHKTRIMEHDFCMFIYQHMNLALQRKNTAIRQWIYCWGIVMINLDYVLCCMRRWQPQSASVFQAKSMVIHQITVIMKNRNIEVNDIDKMIHTLRKILQSLDGELANDKQILAMYIWRLRCAMIPVIKNKNVDKIFCPQ